MINPDWRKQYDQVIYLLQGGGALGAYQVGICEALLEQNCDPDWIIGTSIGGINGAIIAGNKPADRIPQMKKFWSKIAMSVPDYYPEMMTDQMRGAQNMYMSQWAAMFGVNGFFTPRLVNPWLETNTTPDKLSYYDTSELHKTLEEVIDFEILNAKEVRLTVSAICLETGNVTRFDNTRDKFTAKHIMATAALPPGLPAIKIDDKFYWDGGLNSNTPFEVLMEEKIEQKLLCFVINLFAYVDKLPTTMAGVMKRKKDLEYISQHHTLLHYFCELQRFHQTLKKMYAMLPNPEQHPELKEICLNEQPVSLNVARFHYRDMPYDYWSKDFEFSEKSLLERFKMGYEDVQKAFEDPSWLELLDETVQINNF